MNSNLQFKYSEEFIKDLDFFNSSSTPLTVIGKDILYVDELQEGFRESTNHLFIHNLLCIILAPKRDLTLYFHAIKNSSLETVRNLTTVENEDFPFLQIETLEPEELNYHSIKIQMKKRWNWLRKRNLDNHENLLQLKTYGVVLSDFKAKFIVADVIVTNSWDGLCR